MWLLYILQMKYINDLRDVFLEVWFAVVDYNIVDFWTSKILASQCINVAKYIWIFEYNGDIIAHQRSIPLCMQRMWYTHTHALYYIQKWRILDTLLLIFAIHCLFKT